MPLSLAVLVERLKAGYGLVTSGKFGEGLECFQAITVTIAVSLVTSRQQVAELTAILLYCSTIIYCFSFTISIAVSLVTSRQKVLVPWAG